MAKFDDFVAAAADGVDGLYADTMGAVALVVGPASYVLAEKAFRDIATAHLGAESAASYLGKRAGGFLGQLPDARRRQQYPAGYPDTPTGGG